MMILIKASALALPLKNETIQCVVASPPYWGLRDYGVAPTVWDGDPDCHHTWTEIITPAANGIIHEGGMSGETYHGHSATRRPRRSASCSQCGAWLGCLGLEPTPELYVGHIVQVFREVGRVLRKDATCWLNLGDCFATGAGKVGDCPGGGEQGARWVDRGMGPLIQPNRMPIPGLKPKDLCMIPARVAIALQADGWWLRSDIIWAKPNAMTESVKDRPTKIHEHIFLLTKSERYFYDHDAVKEPQEEAERTRRLREQAKGLKTRYDLKRDTQDIGQTPWGKNGVAKSVEARQRLAELGTRNLRSVWTIATQPFHGRHFSTMPEALAERCIKAGSRPGDLVLDPFGGSGTTARVAVRLGRRAVHCDLAYHDLARQTRCTQIQVEAFI